MNCRTTGPLPSSLALCENGTYTSANGRFADSCVAKAIFAADGFRRFNQAVALICSHGSWRVAGNLSQSAKRRSPLTGFQLCSLAKLSIVALRNHFQAAPLQAVFGRAERSGKLLPSDTDSKRNENPVILKSPRCELGSGVLLGLN